jgi:hypothetical protein
MAQRAGRFWRKAVVTVVLTEVRYRGKRPAATSSMQPWVIPAPAPWAKTKYARADEGRSSSAETESAPSTFSFSSCGLTTFISDWPRAYLPVYFSIQSP